MELLEFGKAIAGLSSTTLLAVILVAVLRRWVILPKEVENKDAQHAELLKLKDERIAELKAERDEFRRAAYRALHVGERAASAVETMDDRH